MLTKYSQTRLSATSKHALFDRDGNSDQVILGSQPGPLSNHKPRNSPDPDESKQ